MKSLIIYYSETENTKLMAQTLSIHLNADLARIKDLKRKKGFANRLLSSVHAFRETKTDIIPSKIDLTEYDLIYIGTPTWAGNPAPAIITIIDNCDLRGKDIILFNTMSRSGGKSTLERLEEKVKIRGARVVESFSLKTKDKTPEQVVNDTETIIEILDLKMYKGI